MLRVSRRTFLEIAGASLVCGCSGRVNIPGTPDFPVLAFSDVHFDPFFDPALFAQLNASDPLLWADIFRSSIVKSPSAPGKDTNYPLLALALDSIRQNRGVSPLLLFTGDLLGHGIMQNYFGATGATDVAAMVAFTNKVASFVMQQIRAAAGDVPVVFALGNCDSYTGYGPDSKFLSNTVDMFFTTMLNGAADRADFVPSFTAGGYYAFEPAGMNVMVIGLNTIMFSPLVQNKDGSENNQPAVATELAWFDAKLAAAKAAGKRVWLLMHAPLGADESTTASSVQSDGQIACATMMWETNYQEDFVHVLSKYPGVISFAIAGHTHMDEYRIVSAGNVVEIVPGISPCFTNDPAYKLFRIDKTILAPADYDALSYDVASAPDRFNSHYTFSKNFPVTGSLAYSQKELFTRLASDPKLQALYRDNFFSGSNTPIPITDMTWPVYWSGIGNITGPEIVASVNAYPKSA